MYVAYLCWFACGLPTYSCVPVWRCTVAAINDALAMLEAVAVSATHAVTMVMAGLHTHAFAMLQAVASASSSTAPPSGAGGEVLGRCARCLAQLCRVARRVDAICRRAEAGDRSDVSLVEFLYSDNLAATSASAVKRLMDSEALVSAVVRSIHTDAKPPSKRARVCA